MGRFTGQSKCPWQLQDWFDNAAPDLREAVCASQNQLLHAQAALAKALKGLKQISEFAEPLLKGRLAEHGLDTPLLHTQLLRVEHDWHWLGLRHLYSHRRDSLLQAALQNFADDETFTPESAIALGLPQPQAPDAVGLPLRPCTAPAPAVAIALAGPGQQPHYLGCQCPANTGPLHAAGATGPVGQPADQRTGPAQSCATENLVPVRLQPRRTAARPGPDQRTVRAGPGFQPVPAPACKLRGHPACRRCLAP
ncbi:DUF6543 domain-containing protein [Pseudomonas juntendi]